MTSPIKPLFSRWIKLKITEADGTTSHEFQCAVTQAGLVPSGGDPVTLNTQCPEGSFSEATERSWALAVTAAQDVESATSFQLYLLEHEGETATFLFYPKTDKNGVPVGRGFTGTVVLAPPDQVGNAAVSTYATFTVNLPLQGKYGMVDETGAPIPNKAAVKAGDSFGNEPTITGSDATNAGKLAALGYVAAPPGTAWASGEQFTVNTYPFNWSGTAWAAGAHALAAREPAAAGNGGK
jgi:hypothetical protein